MINRKVLSTALVMFFVLSTGLFAVTAEEIEKMNAAMPDNVVARPQTSRTMLVFNLCNTFKHSSIPYWDKALDIMGRKTGAFTVEHSSDMSVFSDQNLKKYDIICFNNTTSLTPNEAQQKAIMNFIKSGKGIVGIHAATDSFYQWPEGMEMMGGVFTGHPWTGGGTWAVKLDEPDHPLMKSFKGQNFKINDEIYRTDPPLYSRNKQRVLMSLDMSDPTTKNAEGVKPDDMDTGITWIKRVGKGRLFYCSLGHNNHLTWNPAVLGHYLAGIQYAAGDNEVDDSPVGNMAELDTLIAQVRKSEWDNRDAAAQLDLLIRSYYENTAMLAKVEQKLLAALEAKPTLTGIDTICRELKIIGTEKSVPVLSKLAAQPETSAPALYALEKIPGKAVDAALVKTATSTQDTNVQIGIINTLGVRKSESVITLSKQILNDKTDVAIVQALGALGTEAAVTELNRIGSRLSEAGTQRWADAMLMCADARQQTGQRSQAVAIYQKLYKTQSSSLIQAAALAGWVRLDASDAEAVVRAAIEGSDPILQTAGIRSLPYLSKNTSLLKRLATSAAEFPAGVQIQLVTVMPKASETIGRDLAAAMLNSSEEAVRIAACDALEQCGDESVIAPLATMIAQSKSRNEQKAARQTLYRISGKPVDSAVVRQIADYQNSTLNEKAIAELIKATVERGIETAPEVLFRTATADSRVISSESIRALQSLAGPEYMEELVSLLTARPSSATEKAVIIAGEKINARNDRAMILLAEYPKMADNETVQVSMLNVIGKLGDAHAVSLLEKEFSSSNPAIQEAAFRAMADWPGNEFADHMKKLAQSDADAKTKVLAFRAYVQIVGKNMNDGTADELIAAYAFAPRADEQKVVIGALGNTSSTAALKFVQNKLSDSALKAEAQVAAVNICEKIANFDPSSVKPVLQVLKDCDNTSVREKAAELMANLPDFDGMVVDWKIAGPFTASGKNGEALFDHVFAPEEDMNKGQWQDARRLLDRNGMFDLNKLDQGDNRAAYFKTTITSPKATDAVFGIGSDDAVKVWLNGKLVHANNAARAVQKDQDKVKVQLVRGDNTVLVKVVDFASNWGFCMTVADTTGNEIDGLKVNCAI